MHDSQLQRAFATPYVDELHPITYNQIILSPYIEGVLGIDIAFIALSDEKKILEFGKSFLPIETNCNITEKLDFLDLQCSYYARKLEVGITIFRGNIRKLISTSCCQ